MKKRKAKTDTTWDDFCTPSNNHPTLCRFLLFYSSIIRSSPSLKVTVLFICLFYKLVSFRGLHKLQPRPDWFPLGVKFKITNEHPGPLHGSFPPPPPGVFPSCRGPPWYQGFFLPRGSVSHDLLGIF